MKAASIDPWQRYQRFRPWVEPGFWIGLTLLNIVGNSITTGIDIERSGIGDRYAAWEPVVWEASSNLVLLALVPALVAWSRRFPIHLDTWRRTLPWHLLGSVVYSAVHVGAMVALRKVAYAAQGAHYDFGRPLQEFGYEYLKDVRSYAASLVIIALYQLLLRRLQGEARLLDTRDDVAAAPEPAARPERFLVRKLGREFLVAASDIEWAQASGNYVNLHVNGRDYPLRSTIGALHERLDPQRFVRVHRSFLVNLDHVVSIEPLDGGDARLHLRAGMALPCSRTYRQPLRGRIGLPEPGAG